MKVGDLVKVVVGCDCSMDDVCVQKVGNILTIKKINDYRDFIWTVEGEFPLHKDSIEVIVLPTLGELM
jgi:hypothetical protein